MTSVNNVSLTMIVRRLFINEIIFRKNVLVVKCTVDTVCMWRNLLSLNFYCTTLLSGATGNTGNTGQTGNTGDTGK